MKKAERFFETTGMQIEGACRGAMFGYRCYKFGRKPFMFFDEDGGKAVAFKLRGPAKDEALSLSGAMLFNPGTANRPMKNWVSLILAHKDKWIDFAEMAVESLKQELAE